MTGPPSHSTPGARLKAAREARQLSVQDVADALNLTARVVTLLEAEDWKALGRPAFTRGYLRAYARLMGENPDLITQGYVESADYPGGPELKPIQARKPALTELFNKRPGAVLSAAIALAVCVTIGIVWWAWPEDDAVPSAEEPVLRRPPSRPTPPLDAADAEHVARSEPGAASATERFSGEPESGGRAAVAAGAFETVRVDAPPSVSPARPSASSPGTPAASVARPHADRAVEARGSSATNEVQLALAPDARVRRITPEGDDRVVLRFAEDCWVEVKDAAGANLYSDLSRAGDTLELVGDAPFRLLLGYAPGVELDFNGEPVSINPHMRNNVAALVLGQ